MKYFQKSDIIIILKWYCMFNKNPNYENYDCAAAIFIKWSKRLMCKFGKGILSLELCNENKKMIKLLAINVLCWRSNKVNFIPLWERTRHRGRSTQHRSGRIGRHVRSSSVGRYPFNMKCSDGQSPIYRQNGKWCHCIGLFLDWGFYMKWLPIPLPCWGLQYYTESVKMLLIALKEG